LSLSAWLPVASYAALIFTLSSIPTLAPPGHAANADKVAHFLEYALLGGLLARAWGRTLAGRRAAVRIALAVVMGAGIAALDETFQGTVGRDKSLGDWVTDLAAVTIAVSVDAWLRGRTTSPHWLWRREHGETRRSTHGSTSS
jgi:VanZ family protein